MYPLYRYRVTSRRVFVEDTGVVTAYGIAIDGDDRCTQVVEDISTDFYMVNALCIRLRTAMLSPLHLADVIADWLSDAR